jgi:2-dehydro-3-deoxygluconokinase
VVKLGSLGAFALVGDRAHRAPTQPVDVVDAVGAGDAFVAGYLSEQVAGSGVPDCLRMGNTLGGAVCRAPGDWEGLPTRDDLAEQAADEIIR